MSDLYSISFTTKKLIKKYDEKGVMIGETQMNTPISLTALPYKTAMTYSGCDNFKLSHYVPEHRGGKRGGLSDNKAWGAPASKKAARARVVEEQKTANPAVVANKAAMQGDLSAAINKG